MCALAVYPGCPLSGARSLRTSCAIMCARAQLLLIGGSVALSHAAHVPRLHPLPRCGVWRRRCHRLVLTEADEHEADDRSTVAPADDPAGAPFGALPGAEAVYDFIVNPRVEVVLAVPVLYCCVLFALSTLTCSPELFAVSSLTCSVCGAVLGTPDDSVAHTRARAAGQPEYDYLIRTAEKSISVFFAVEYFVRWYSVSLRPGYLVKPSSLIDLIYFLNLKTIPTL